MAVLSAPDLRREIESRRIVFEPSVDPRSQIKQVSVDLRLGSKFTSFKEKPGYLPHVRVDPSLFQSQDLWQEVELDQYTLPPGGFVLGRTLEVVQVPSHLVGLVEGRSSWARTGVSIHLTAPIINPGFVGPVTLEMANMGKIPVQLVSGEDRPAQLMFIRLTEALPDSELYGSSEGDIFQYQEGPLPKRR